MEQAVETTLSTAAVSFVGRALVVVGGASGIGAEVVAALARAGAEVDVLDRAHPGEKALGPEVTHHAVDVRDRAAVAATLGRVLEQRGRVDGLVYAAGVLDGYATLEEITPELLQVVLEVNCVGAVNVLQQVVPAMKAASYGRVVLFGSIAGLVAGAGGIAYTMSKHAVHGLAQHLAVELGPHGITTNVVAPGSVQGTGIRTGITTIAEAGAVATDRGLGVSSPQQAAALYPVGRLGTIDAVVPTVLHLLQESSWFINGATVTVDGGYTAK